MIVSTIEFPSFTGISCNMMPFIQGDPNSLPDPYKPYAHIIEENFLEKGEIGLLSIQESYVESNTSQRGYNSAGIPRNVHIEVGRGNGYNRWGSSWGGRDLTRLEDSTMVLIANSISDTCRVWNSKDLRYTPDGDLSEYIEDYPEESGIMLKSGELARISIFTPHECVAQKHSGYRQFFRIVGMGVKGREPYFTINPLIDTRMLN